MGVRGQRRLQVLLVHFFNDQMLRAIRLVETRHLAHKATGDAYLTIDDVRRIMADFDNQTATWRFLIEPLIVAFDEMASRAIDAAASDIGVTDTRILDRLDTDALQFSRTRAAELVGRRWTSGELQEAPNAQWNIIQFTRDELQRILDAAVADRTPVSQVAANIRSSYIFSDARASRIVETELRRVNMRTIRQVAVQSGTVTHARWVLHPAHVQSDVCDVNARAGFVPIGQPFPSGDEFPGAHPNCLCGLEFRQVARAA